MLANGMTSRGGRHEISSVCSYPLLPDFPPLDSAWFSQHIRQRVSFPVPRPNADPSTPEGACASPAAPHGRNRTTLRGAPLPSHTSDTVAVNNHAPCPHPLAELAHRASRSR